LRNEEERFEQDLGYWRVMFDATYALREDEALLLKVASRAHALDPASVEWQFNYAAALLIGRWRVEEALGLTMQLLARHPASAGARINHAIALIYTGRVAEAEALLREVDADRLVAAQAAAYRFAFAGVHRAREDWDRVREDLRVLEGERLFPSQQRWLEQIRRAIPGPS
jgi:predicted Zn-dependent protease